MRINLLPVIEAFKQNVAAGQTASAFKDLVVAKMTKQIQTRTDAEKKMWDLSVNKVERNALASIIIEEVARQFFDSLRFDEKQQHIEASGDVWDVRFNGKARPDLTQQHIEDTMTKIPNLVVGLHIYRETPDEQKILRERNTALGFGTIFGSKEYQYDRLMKRDPDFLL